MLLVVEKGGNEQINFLWRVRAGEPVCDHPDLNGILFFTAALGVRIDRREPRAIRQALLHW